MPTTTTTTTTTTSGGGKTTTTTVTVTTTKSGPAPSAEEGVPPVSREEYLQAHYPEAPDEITNMWLSHLVGATVEGFDYKALSGGYVSDGGIITPKYSGQQGQAPASLVLKFKAESPDMAEAASGTNMYRKELIFYTKMRDIVDGFMPCACHTHVSSFFFFL
eukprot:COSAG05_NODE_1358_length_5103_cov_18.985811_6_plen_162_part_00